jgi:hypothetical protein
VGVPLGVLAVVLGLLGYKSLSDVSKAGDDAKHTIQEQEKQFREQADRITKEGEAVSRGYHEQQKQLNEVSGQLPGLKNQLAVFRAISSVPRANWPRSPKSASRFNRSSGPFSQG